MRESIAKAEKVKATQEEEETCNIIQTEQGTYIHIYVHNNN